MAEPNYTELRKRLTAPSLRGLSAPSGLKRLWNELLHPRDRYGRFRDKPDFKAGAAGLKIPSTAMKPSDVPALATALSNALRGNGIEAEIGAWAAAPGEKPSRAGFKLDVWGKDGDYLGRMRLKGEKKGERTQWGLGAFVKPGQKIGGEGGAHAEANAARREAAQGIREAGKNLPAEARKPIDAEAAKLESEARRASVAREPLREAELAAEDKLRGPASRAQTAVKPGEPPIPGMKMKNAVPKDAQDTDLFGGAAGLAKLRLDGQQWKMPAGYKIVGFKVGNPNKPNRHLYIATGDGKDLHKLAFKINPRDGGYDIYMDRRPGKDGIYQNYLNRRRKNGDAVPSAGSDRPASAGAVAQMDEKDARRNAQEEYNQLPIERRRFLASKAASVIRAGGGDYKAQKLLVEQHGVSPDVARVAVRAARARGAEPASAPGGNPNRATAARVEQEMEARKPATSRGGGGSKPPSERPAPAGSPSSERRGPQNYIDQIVGGLGIVDIMAARPLDEWPGIAQDLDERGARMEAEGDPRAERVQAIARLLRRRHARRAADAAPVESKPKRRIASLKPGDRFTIPGQDPKVYEVREVDPRNGNVAQAVDGAGVIQPPDELMVDVQTPDPRNAGPNPAERPWEGPQASPGLYETRGTPVSDAVKAAIRRDNPNLPNELRVEGVRGNRLYLRASGDARFVVHMEERNGKYVLSPATPRGLLDLNGVERAELRGQVRAGASTQQLRDRFRLTPEAAREAKGRLQAPAPAALETNEARQVTLKALNVANFPFFAVPQGAPGFDNVMLVFARRMREAGNPLPDGALIKGWSRDGNKLEVGYELDGKKFLVRFEGRDGGWKAIGFEDPAARAAELDSQMAPRTPDTGAGIASAERRAARRAEFSGPATGSAPVNPQQDLLDRIGVKTPEGSGAPVPASVVPDVAAVPGQTVPTGFKFNRREGFEADASALNLPAGWNVVAVKRRFMGSDKATKYHVVIEGPGGEIRMIPDVPFRYEGRGADRRMVLLGNDGPNGVGAPDAPRANPRTAGAAGAQAAPARADGIVPISASQVPKWIGAPLYQEDEADRWGAETAEASRKANEFVDKLNEGLNGRDNRWQHLWHSTDAVDVNRALMLNNLGEGWVAFKQLRDANGQKAGVEAVRFDGERVRLTGFRYDRAPRERRRDAGAAGYEVVGAEAERMPRLNVGTAAGTPAAVRALVDANNAPAGSAPALTGPPVIYGAPVKNGVPVAARGVVPPGGNYPNAEDLRLPPGYRVLGFKPAADARGRKNGILYVGTGTGKGGDVHAVKIERSPYRDDAMWMVRYEQGKAAREQRLDRAQARRLRRMERGEAGTATRMRAERQQRMEEAAKQRLDEVRRMVGIPDLPASAIDKDLNDYGAFKVIHDGKLWNMRANRERVQLIEGPLPYTPPAENAKMPDDHIVNPKPFDFTPNPDWLENGEVTQHTERQSDSVNKTFFANAPDGHGLLLKPEKGGYDGYVVAKLIPVTPSDYGGAVVGDVPKDGLNREMGGQIVARALGVRMPRTAIREIDMPEYTTREGRTVPAGKDQVLAVERLPDGAYTHRGAPYNLVNKVPAEEWKRIAVLDTIIGNLDRHDGNAMIDAEGRLWAIDHGLSFPDPVDQKSIYRGNTMYQDLHSGPIPESILKDVQEMQVRWDEVARQLRAAGLTQNQIDSAKRRLDRMVETKRIPRASETVV